ncbi:unnamed protein product [Rotaria magnacalcarata]|uniref:Uncharacterized protein n=1 Tax=Rotaria magnacalcarata TaxID=392030 RepID=A0A816UL18_9BILA|nr:unnamed protein product [Rotaria magnacalcarata]
MIRNRLASVAPLNEIVECVTEFPINVVNDNIQPTSIVTPNKSTDNIGTNEPSVETELRFEECHVKFLKSVAAGEILNDHPKLIGCFKTMCQQNTDPLWRGYFTKVCFIPPCDARGLAQYMLKCNGDLTKQFKEECEKMTTYMMSVEARVNESGAIDPNEIMDMHRVSLEDNMCVAMVSTGT